MTTTVDQNRNTQVVSKAARCGPDRALEDKLLNVGPANISWTRAWEGSVVMLCNWMQRSRTRRSRLHWRKRQPIMTALIMMNQRLNLQQKEREKRRLTGCLVRLLSRIRTTKLLFTVGCAIKDHHSSQHRGKGTNLAQLRQHSRARKMSSSQH